MPKIVTADDTDVKQQNRLLTDDYPGFIYSAVYGFLFEGLNLREIEGKYLGKECQGFFAKSVLNFVDIDTSRNCKNRGMFAGKDVEIIAKALLSDEDPVVNNIGRILLKDI